MAIFLGHGVADGEAEGRAREQAAQTAGGNPMRTAPERAVGVESGGPVVHEMRHNRNPAGGAAGGLREGDKPRIAQTGVDHRGAKLLNPARGGGRQPERCEIAQRAGGKMQADAQAAVCARGDADRADPVFQEAAGTDRTGKFAAPERFEWQLCRGQLKGVSADGSILRRTAEHQLAERIRVPFREKIGDGDALRTGARNGVDGNQQHARHMMAGCVHKTGGSAGTRETGEMWSVRQARAWHVPTAHAYPKAMPIRK